jgi:hypothetical protein
MSDPAEPIAAPSVAPDEPDALPTRQLLAVLLPGLAVVTGFGLWLWSRHGLVVWFDSAAAFIAGCLG